MRKLTTTWMSALAGLLVCGGTLTGCGDDSDDQNTNPSQSGTCEAGQQDKDGDGVCMPACAADSCQTNAVCDDSTGQIACTCAVGYTGDKCDQCASGYVKYPEGSSFCVADVCKDDPCKGPGQVAGSCEVTGTGSYQCDCETGYAGDKCQSCAAGFHADQATNACVPDAGCEANTCGGHGSCDDSTGTPVCTCDEGYAGNHCDSCANGYQDKDTDGTCTADCTTAGLDCGDHGTCTDASGTAECDCDDGYQDNDSNGTCEADCTTAALQCGTNGACDDSSGTAECKCLDGYEGEECAACTTGYQDNDADGVCAPDCTTAGLQCSNGTCSDASGTAECDCNDGYQDNDHDGTCEADCTTAGLTCNNGQCVDTSGTAVCECGPEYTGTNCDACASGYQDNDNNGTCAPTCATAGYTCAGHGTCVDSSGQATCDCDDGYVPQNNTCVAGGNGHTCAGPIPLDLGAGTVTGDTTGAGDDSKGSCGSTGAPELVYSFTVAQPITATFTTTGYDTTMYLRSDCTSLASEIDCDDDDGPGTGSQITASLNPGQYYLFVDGYNDDDHGEFELAINVACGTGMIFDSSTGTCVDNPCLPNPCTVAHQQLCVPVLPASYECNCDPGYIPDPSAPANCIVDPNPHGEQCADAMPLGPGEGTVSGSTADAQNNGSGSCAGDGPDRVYGFTLQDKTRVEFLMTGYDTVLHLRTQCDTASSQVMCNDDTQGTNAGLTGVLDPGTYYLWADSYGSGGAYELSYSFRTDPCADDEAVCPGTPVCQPSTDWTSSECVCPAGMVPFGSTCVDNPCDPNPCTLIEHKNKCVAELPGNYHCECSPGYIPDTMDPDACMMDPNANEWTFMVFLNGDNNLEEYGYEDIVEMGADNVVGGVTLPGGSNPYVNVVVLMDPYSQNGGNASYLYVRRGGTDTIETVGEVDMGSWQQLASFGSWVINHYPARHYALVMWDHGAGWEKKRASTPLLKGFSNDDHGTYAGISVSNGDYARALAAITSEIGGKIDLVGFDACLMGMWEVANATAPYAKVLVASEETEPAAGWPYEEIIPRLTANHTMTAAELGTIIVDAYHNEATNNDTLAAIDLETIDALNTAVSNFADALRANPSFFSTLRGIVNNTQSFSWDPFYDLQDFATRVVNHASAPQAAKDAGAALITQLGVSIIHNQSYYSGAHGLAVYIPSGAMQSEYTQSGAIWSQLATWDEFLAAFSN